MESFLLLASVYKLGLGCGLFTKEEVIEWCDKVIEVKEQPPYEIIEVALMSNSKIDDIEEKLCEIIGYNTNETYSVKLVLSLLHSKYSNNIFNVEKTLKNCVRLLVQNNFYTCKEFYELYNLDDCYDLAKDNIYHDLNQVVSGFEKEMVKFEQYLDDFKNLYYKEMNTSWSE